MKYKVKIKIVASTYWFSTNYYKMVAKFYRLPNYWIRFNNNISNTVELFNSLKWDETGECCGVENEDFIDECSVFLTEKKDELYDMIKNKLVEKLTEIREQCKYDEKIDSISKLDKVIREINKNLVIEIIE